MIEACRRVWKSGGVREDGLVVAVSWRHKQIKDEKGHSPHPEAHVHTHTRVH